MKKMKRLAAFLLAMVMMLAMAMPAMAAEINVSGVKKDETYTAYKLLNYTAADTDSDDTNDAFSYYLTKAQYDTGLGTILVDAGFTFAMSPDGKIYTVSNTTATMPSAETIVAALNTDEVKAQLATKAIFTKTATANADGAINFTGLEIGYYFIDSSMGSLCELKSYADQEIVFEKNSVPSQDKKQSLTDGGNYTDDKLDLNVGDTVYYQIEVTDGTGTDAEITLTDTMTEGLTFNQDSIKVYASSVEEANKLTENTQYTVTGKSNRGFTLTLSSDYVETLDTNVKVYVRYSATINEKAVVNNDSANSNTSTLTYSHQTATDTVCVETYDFIVKKVIANTETFLGGAEFKLYNAATGGDQILLSKDDTGYYVDKTGDAATTIDINNVNGENVRGLAPGTYYLEEVVTPNGYNGLSAREPVTITEGRTASVKVTIENSTGNLLPTTGGMGTTIFYILGGILVIGAGVLFVTRKRMDGVK